MHCRNPRARMLGAEWMEPGCKGVYNSHSRLRTGGLAHDGSTPPCGKRIGCIRFRSLFYQTLSLEVLGGHSPLYLHFTQLSPRFLLPTPMSSISSSLSSFHLRTFLFLFIASQLEILLLWKEDEELCCGSDSFIPLFVAVYSSVSVNLCRIYWVSPPSSPPLFPPLPLPLVYPFPLLLFEAGHGDH